MKEAYMYWHIAIKYSQILLIQWGSREPQLENSWSQLSIDAPWCAEISIGELNMKRVSLEVADMRQFSKMSLVLLIVESDIGRFFWPEPPVS